MFEANASQFFVVSRLVLPSLAVLASLRVMDMSIPTTSASEPGPTANPGRSANIFSPSYTAAAVMPDSPLSVCVATLHSFRFCAAGQAQPP